MTRITNRLMLVATIACALTLVASTEASAQSRLRLGVEGGFGGEWGTPRGFSTGVFGQLGLQLNDTFAIYYQPSMIVHAMTKDEDNPDVFLAFGNIAMAEITGGMLQFGFGAGADLGRFARCDSGGCNEGDLEMNPALAGRIAVVIPLRTPRARLGIPIALQVHSTFFDGFRDRDARVTSLLLTAGIQRF